jgi:hypothetical protein
LGGVGGGSAPPQAPSSIAPTIGATLDRNFIGRAPAARRLANLPARAARPAQVAQQARRAWRAAAARLPA